MYLTPDEMEKRGFVFTYPEEKNEGKFYQLPKQFYTCPFYKKYLNSTAREVYALLWDRNSLSSTEENREEYTDEKGRVFIIYTRQKVMDILRLSKQTCSEAFRALNLTGLIFEKRRGQGKANHIYVLKVRYYNENESRYKIEEAEELLSLEKTVKEEKKLQKSKNQTSEKKPKKQGQKSKKQTSKSLNTRPLEVENLDGNNTDTIYTDFSETENTPSLSILDQAALVDKWVSIQSILKDKYGEEKYNANLKSLNPVSVKDNVITLEAPNFFTKELIHTRYHEALIKIFKAVGYEVDIDYIVKEA